MKIKSLVLSFNRTAKLNLAMVALAATSHGLLMLSFEDEYRAALHSFSASVINLFMGSWLLVVGIFNWCFVFTGWFFLPLAYCLWVSASNLIVFLKADWQKTPLPKEECKTRLFGNGEQKGAVYIGGKLAVDIGMVGTIFYIMAGLYLMGETMSDMAGIIATAGDGGNMMEILPFNKMAGASLKIVPALGTTLVGLVSEMMINHAKKIARQWYA